MADDEGFGSQRRRGVALQAAELRRLEAGVAQRAHLFEALLADLSHGERVVRAGALPAPFAAGHPRKLASGVTAYAADLARCADGEWRVVADRVAPAGVCGQPGLAAFLPGLCRLLLGQRLRLASVPALWLGDASALRTVTGSYRRWLIRDAFDAGVPPIALAGLAHEERRDLQARLDAAPWRFVAVLRVSPAPGPGPGHGEGETPGLLRLPLERERPQGEARAGAAPEMMAAE